ncbi:MAG: cyclase family protein [Candidatus Rokubacteria bacterium]|nr:cyclase family protein [Candidatus Rokubacteria bacterium]
MQNRRVVPWVVTLAVIVFVVGFAVPADAQMVKGWVKGKGYGWIWGPNDEIGALNAITEQKVLAALRIPKQGKVYDLGILYDRGSFQWPGHSPAEVMSFRTPEGLKRQDLESISGQKHVAWHSAAVFVNDNVGTQIDSLCHVTTGDDNHWYNGYKESEWGSNFGPRRACADKMPPVITRGVLIDVTGAKGQLPLPSGPTS